jgi:hypothetical protein
VPQAALLRRPDTPRQASQQGERRHQAALDGAVCRCCSHCWWVRIEVGGFGRVWGRDSSESSSRTAPPCCTLVQAIACKGVTDSVDGAGAANWFDSLGAHAVRPAACGCAVAP